MAPQVQKALGTDPLSPQAQTEGTVLLGLFALFSLIILEGLLLALSVSNVCWPLTGCSSGQLHRSWPLHVLTSSMLGCMASWLPQLIGAFFLLQGFLPESVDQFATDYIYKSFSPTVECLSSAQRSTVFGRCAAWLSPTFPMSCCR